MFKRRVKNQIDSWPLKVWNCPNFFACKWHVTYHWKALNEGYNFASNLTSIGGLHTKLWAPKVVEIPILGISGLPFLKVLEQNDIWVLVPRLGTKYTIRGKVMAFLKPGLWWILWICVCSWIVYASKVFQLCTNQLVVWFVQVCVNNWPTYHSS
jgi:hypothetical protein